MPSKGSKEYLNWLLDHEALLKKGGSMQQVTGVTSGPELRGPTGQTGPILDASGKPKKFTKFSEIREVGGPIGAPANVGVVGANISNISNEKAAAKEGMKILVPIYPNFSQAKGLILLLAIFLVAIGLPAGWFGIQQDIVDVSLSPDGEFYIMQVEEEPGFIRGWFRDGGTLIYVRRTEGDESKWYTYPDSRPLFFGSSYEEMFNGWAIEQAVKKNPLPIEIQDENR